VVLEGYSEGARAILRPWFDLELGFGASELRSYRSSGLDFEECFSPI